jgi:hypothetical protein
MRKTTILILKLNNVLSEKTKHFREHRYRTGNGTYLETTSTATLQTQQKKKLRKCSNDHNIPDGCTLLSIINRVLCRL